MKIPHKVWIRGKVAYFVVWVDRFDDKRNRGECCPRTKQIFLLKGMKDDVTLQTFVHELFHAIEFEYKLPIPHGLIYKLEKIVCKLLVGNGVKLTWEPEA